MPNVRGRNSPIQKLVWRRLKRKDETTKRKHMARKVGWVVARYEQKRTHKPQAMQVKAEAKAQVQEMAQCLF